MLRSFELCENRMVALNQPLIASPKTTLSSATLRRYQNKTFDAHWWTQKWTEAPQVWSGFEYILETWDWQPLDRNPGGRGGPTSPGTWWPWTKQNTQLHQTKQTVETGTFIRLEDGYFRLFVTCSINIAIQYWCYHLCYCAVPKAQFLCLSLPRKLSNIGSAQFPKGARKLESKLCKLIAGRRHC